MRLTLLGSARTGPLLRKEKHKSTIWRDLFRRPLLQHIATAIDAYGKDADEELPADHHAAAGAESAPDHRARCGVCLAFLHKGISARGRARPRRDDRGRRRQSLPG